MIAFFVIFVIHTIKYRGDVFIMVEVKLKISFNNEILRFPCLIIIKNMHNEVIYKNKFNCLDKISVFLTKCCAYKVYVIHSANVLGVFFIYARENELYNVNLTSNKHIVSICLMDANYPNLKITESEINLCKKNISYQ